jgi:hypothetical protein
MVAQRETRTQERGRSDIMTRNLIRLTLGFSVGAAVLLMALPAFAQKNPDRDAFFGQTHIRIIMMLADTPVEVAIYKDANKYVAVRSTVFGYANFEVEKMQPRYVRGR